MSQENVEIIRRGFEASSEGDLGVWFQMADPRPAEPDAANEYRGLDGVMDFVVNWYSQWHIVEGPDRAGCRTPAIRLQNHGRPAATCASA